jgi:hypothetical protein
LLPNLPPSRPRQRLRESGSPHSTLKFATAIAREALCEIRNYIRRHNEIEQGSGIVAINLVNELCNLCEQG